MILAAIAAAFFLVPVAHAGANATIKVNIAGTGTGKVKDVQLYSTAEPEPIDCPSVCEGTMQTGNTNEVFGAFAGAGSEFVGWTVNKGVVENYCDGSEEEKEFAVLFGEAFPEYEGMDGVCFMEPSGGGIEITATFNKKGGPTRTITLTKSPSSSTGGGTGSVASKPKGIKCGATCDEAVASEYKEVPVELTAKASTGSTFVKWLGTACNESTSTTCTIPAGKADQTVQAVFGSTSKAFSPAEALTVAKAGSGKGTVKAAGLGCEAECSSTTVLYQGPITEPKPKAGKTVILKQSPAFGSKFTGWSGCDSVTEAGECVIEMDENHTIEAEYEALPNKTLTVNKAYAKGNGSVASKPKGIKCATTCTQAVAQMPEGAAVELVAKPTTGTFVKWEGGDCNGKTEAICVVTMNTDETTTAVFSEPGKAIAEAKTLTLSKAGSGFGTVKAAGLACEVLCSSTSVLYQGPTTKPGKTVILKAVSAPGSTAVEWSGCDSVTEAGECVVAMESNKVVTATFNELE